MGRPALLVLHSGEIYEGLACGRAGTAIGEVVFNTALTGYQEVLTDPSYAGQLVTMTYPHIGNYGVNGRDVESARVQPAGFIVRDMARRPSNYRSQQGLVDYLDEAGVTAIAEIDTRALTRRIREGGAVMGIIAHDARRDRAPALLEQLRSAPAYGDVDFVSRVTSAAPLRVLADEAASGLRLVALDDAAPPDPARHLVVMDFGVKYSILRNLISRGAEPTLVPSTASAEDVLALSPRGVLLSNGPGDPAQLGAIVQHVRQLLGRTSVYGICLGHQLMAMAFGASTFKLKYGHRGANQPVRIEDSGRVAITSQNHGYAVDPEGLPDEVGITHVNLNDGTVEGIRHREIVAESVQFHPEAGPGPYDARPFFERIVGCLGEATR